jgi:hypothetical protein
LVSIGQCTERISVRARPEVASHHIRAKRARIISCDKVHSLSPFMVFLSSPDST